MQNDQNTILPARKGRSIIPTFSSVLDDGTLVELLYDPEERQTRFAVGKDGTWRFEDRVPINGRQRLAPYSAENSLVRNEIVLLPSEPEEYGSEQELIREIHAYIHRYVDLSPRFEQIATYYALFTWLYDSYNELPYLRFRGDYGTGKTRALLVIGSLCNKPIFASACSTISPIFRLIDATAGGTLVLDEADFLFSDEKAEIVKILNNGNVKGLPVLRTEITPSKEFNPTAYRVYGPKMIATRGYYADAALESRFIVEEMGQRPLRDDIPINLPESYKAEARLLRNKLLLYRFRTFGKKPLIPGVVEASVEPRLRQIFIPLLSVISNNELRNELRQLVYDYNRQLIMDRGMDVEAQVLEVIRELCLDPERKKLSVKNVTATFIERFGADYERRITAKWIGTIIRRKLQLKTQKSDGNFVLPPTELPKLQRLYERYGIVEVQGNRRDTDSTPEAADKPDTVDVRDNRDVAEEEGLGLASEGAQDDQRDISHEEGV